MPQIKTTKFSDDSRFTISLTPDSYLESGMLILEDADGNYGPISLVSNEAKSFAADDLRARLLGLESNEGTALCPCKYKRWARGINGTFHVAMEIEA
jgi:hypothetical protein